MILYYVSDKKNIPTTLKNTYFYKHKSLIGFWQYLRSTFVFHTHGAFLNTSNANQTVVCLWHGMPIKNIMSFDKRNIHVTQSFQFSYTIATSDLYQQIIAKSFGCDVSQVLISGLPRNDLLFIRNGSLERLGIVYNIKPKVVIWLPTFRKYKSTKHEEGENSTYGIPFVDGKLEKFNQLLMDMGVIVLIKMHPYQLVVEKFNYSNLKLIKESELKTNDIQLYELLGESDALITDYSSVFVDYLATNRPIGFAFDDFENYNADRRFVFNNVFDYMPGYFIHNYDALIEFCADISKGVDKSEQLREQKTFLLNKFHDNQNCKRIEEVIFKLTHK